MKIRLIAEVILRLIHMVSTIKRFNGSASAAQLKDGQLGYSFEDEGLYLGLSGRAKNILASSPVIARLEKLLSDLDSKLTGIESKPEPSGETVKASLRANFEYKNINGDAMNVLQYADRQPNAWVGSKGEFERIHVIRGDKRYDGTYFIVDED